MPTFATWATDEGTAAFDADSIIARDPVSLTLARGTSTTVAAQTVRIVPAGTGGAGANELRGMEGSKVGETLVVVIGTDALDIARDDRFVLNSVRYQVISVDKTMNGKVEALARGIQ